MDGDNINGQELKSAMLTEMLTRLCRLASDKNVPIPNDIETWWKIQEPENAQAARVKRLEYLYLRIELGRKIANAQAELADLERRANEGVSS